MRRVMLVVVVIGVAALAAAMLLYGDGAAPVGASTAADGSTITVIDLAGRKVTVRQPVERIVLLRGRDIYEIALLLGDETERKVVAWGPDAETADRDAWQVFIERFPGLAKTPPIGAIFSDAVNAEEILALKPDLVVADVVMKERRYRSIDQMAAAGLPVLFLDFSNDPFSGPQRSINLLGRVLGREERAKQVTAFVDAELDKVFSRVPPGEGPSVYVEAGSQGPDKFGSSYGYDAGGRMSSWGVPLERLRCRNIAANVVRGMGQISPEYVLKCDPDVILITGAYWPGSPGAMHLGYLADRAASRRLLQGFTARPGWSGLRAVRDGRVYSVFHGFCMHTTDFAALQQLAKWFYPETFADLDPEAALRTFHERFLPVAYRGTWMIGANDPK